MSETAVRMVEASALTTSAVSYYASPSNTKTIIRQVSVFNNDTVARLITIYLVPSGNSAGTANVSDAKTVAAGKSQIFYSGLNQVLEAGDFLAAKADASAVVILQASGYQLVDTA